MLAVAVVATVLLVLFAFHKEEPASIASATDSIENVVDVDNNANENVADADSVIIRNSNLIDVYGKDYAPHIGGNGIYNTFFVILICMIGLSLVAMLVFWVLSQANKFMNDSKYWIKFLCVLAICAIVLVLSFALSSGNDVSEEFLKKYELDPDLSRPIGAICILCYILAAGAILSILGTEIAKLFKKK